MVTKEEIKIIVIVICLGISGMLGIDIHLASLPAIKQAMQTTDARMQQSISMYLLGMGVSLLFYGPLSDKYGRKPIVLFGLSLATVTSFAAGFSHSIGIFLLLRLLQGVGSGVCMGLGRTIIVDVIQGERLSTLGSYFSIFVSLSPLFAPTIGGYIQHAFGWRANFITLGLILFVVGIIYGGFCPETNRYKNQDAMSQKAIWGNYAYLLKQRLFVGCTLITGIAMGVNMVYPTTSAFIMQEQYHLSPVAYGWLTSLIAFGGMCGKLLNPFVVKRVGCRSTMFWGILCFMVTGVLLLSLLWLGALGVSAIVIGVFIAMAGFALVNPNSVALALSPFHEKRGAAGALYGSFQMLTAFTSSAAIGAMANYGVYILASSYLILGIIGAVIYRFVVYQCE